MTTTPVTSGKQAGKAIVHKAKDAAAKPWVERLERFGFVTRGLIYATIGVLALELAAGAGGATTSPTSAIALIGRQPSGKVLLAIIAVGLVGYSLWGFVRAILDPLGRGTDAKGLVDRAGFLFSGLANGALLIPTVLALTNQPAGSAQGGTAGVPATLMTGPYGKWLVLAIGLFWIVTGAAQVYVAYTARFTRDLKTGTMSAQEIKSATWLGKIGIAARGAVFALIGVIIFQTVFATGVNQPQGFDGALAALAHAPYGEVLLGAVAIGLIMFGAYSALCAKWNRISARRSV